MNLGLSIANTLEIKEKLLFITILVIFTVTMLFPQVAIAEGAPAGRYVEELRSVTNLDLLSARMAESSARLLPLPIAKKEGYTINKDGRYFLRVPSTAYSSTVDQCDSTPCIAADGFNVCENNAENVIAANFLPFGTKVKIPAYFGDRIFVVHDRMNARYGYRLDIWMTSRDRAKAWGVRYIDIEIVE